MKTIYEKGEKVYFLNEEDLKIESGVIDSVEVQYIIKISDRITVKDGKYVFNSKQELINHIMRLPQGNYLLFLIQLAY